VPGTEPGLDIVTKWKYRSYQELSPSYPACSCHFTDQAIRAPKLFTFKQNDHKLHVGLIQDYLHQTVKLFTWRDCTSTCRLSIASSLSLSCSASLSTACPCASNDGCCRCVARLCSFALSSSYETRQHCQFISIWTVIYTRIIQTTFLSYLQVITHLETGRYTRHQTTRTSFIYTVLLFDFTYCYLLFNLPLC
jgi:hypothetical protein